MALIVFFVLLNINVSTNYERIIPSIDILSLTMVTLANLSYIIIEKGAHNEAWAPISLGILAMLCVLKTIYYLRKPKTAAAK
jgi:hypothetical protein